MNLIISTMHALCDVMCCYDAVNGVLCCVMFCYVACLQGQESVYFGDVLCQMLDMISPEDPLAITFADLARKKNVSGVLFDVLFNLHKFMRFETRDPFQEKQKRDDMFGCD